MAKTLLKLLFAISCAALFNAQPTLAEEAEDPKLTQSDDYATKPEPSPEKQAIESEEAIENTGRRERAIRPEVLRDLAALPFPTRRMHELILEVTKSGEIEKLRALIGTGDNATQLSLGEFDGDPVDFLKSQSGDEMGHEILAILSDVLDAGFVHMDKGTEYEMFVWPYFSTMPLDQLTPEERVEMFRIITYGDYQDMKDFGGYIFYRVGISPTGRWHFFVAGD